MRIVGVCMAALPVCLTLCLGHSFAADPGAPLDEELTKQKAIYLSRGEKRLEGYVIDRTLSSYAETLLPGFEAALANLGPGGRWLDIGAGSGRAILDYFAPVYDATRAVGQARPDGKVQAVAISIEDRRTSVWHKTAASLGENQIRYLFSKTLREYSRGRTGAVPHHYGCHRRSFLYAGSLVVRGESSRAARTGRQLLYGPAGRAC